MVIIDSNKCIGCGQCVRDCFEKNLSVENGRAVVKGTCFSCGHCIAVCPMDACSIDDMPADGIVPVSPMSDPESFLNAVKSRRSIRRYLTKKVEREKVEQLIEAGRYTATGSNAQDVSYIVVQDTLDAARPYIFEGLDRIARQFIDNGTPGLYAYRWKAMAERYRTDPDNRRDDLLFEAPMLLILNGDETNCALAAANIEMMAQNLGLGVLYSGFIRRALSRSAEARQIIGLTQDAPTIVLLVGYPDVKYLRTVPRKKPEVLWK